MKRMRVTIIPAVAAVALCLAPLGGTAVAQTRPVSVRLQDTLSTENAREGQRFEGTLAAPLISSGRVIAPEGSRVTGRVVSAVSSGRLKRPAEITLRLDRVEARGRSYPISVGDLTVKQSSHATRNVVIIGGSAGAGAVIGGVAGGGKGSAIGAAIGAGAGALTAFLTGKREIELPAETVLNFQLRSVTISAAELRRLQRYDAAPVHSERSESAEQARGEVYEDRDSYPRARRRHHRQDDEDYDDDDDDRVYTERSERVLVFFPDERDIIYDFYRGGGRRGLPPGLAKRRRLPPGLEKQLRERGTLPPGLQKRVEPLPYELEHRLHRLPDGYRRVFIEGSVVILNNRTSVIYAVLRL